MEGFESQQTPVDGMEKYDADLIKAKELGSDSATQEELEEKLTEAGIDAHINWSDSEEEQAAFQQGELDGLNEIFNNSVRTKSGAVATIVLTRADGSVL